MTVKKNARHLTEKEAKKIAVNAFRRFIRMHSSDCTIFQIEHFERLYEMEKEKLKPIK